jgi:hypothetical protein
VLPIVAVMEARAVLKSRSRSSTSTPGFTFFYLCAAKKCGQINFFEIWNGYNIVWNLLTIIYLTRLDEILWLNDHWKAMKHYVSTSLWRTLSNFLSVNFVQKWFIQSAPDFWGSAFCFKRRSIGPFDKGTGHLVTMTYVHTGHKTRQCRSNAKRHMWHVYIGKMYQHGNKHTRLPQNIPKWQ